MAPRTTLNDPQVIRRSIAEASEALARVLAQCEDRDGSYRAMLDKADLIDFKEVIHHLCEAAGHLDRAARYAASL